MKNEKFRWSLPKSLRYIQSRFEAIPAPAAIVYNAIPRKILAKPERKIKMVEIASHHAKDIGKQSLL